MRQVLLLGLLLLGSTALAAPGASRFAVLIGNDEGAPQRARLWFAERDADRVAGALEELGGFPASQVQVLRGQHAPAVRAALARVEAQLSRSPERGKSLLVVYYSGHAGSAGLELGSDVVSFEELRSWVARSSAAVKVVVVDACEAGALTQVKGTRALPGLDFPLPLPDDSVRGVAYLASTAVGEPAQESASLGGSFFSHHLEVALRGAADGDGDGRVTLTEAFRYTAAQTIVGTAATVQGSQHPTYELKMSGRGDVVLSDLRRAEARLVLGADPAGQYLIRGGPGVLAEVAGGLKPITLALPAGHYELQRREGRARAGAELTLLPGQTLAAPKLTPLRLEVGAVKGGERTEVFVGPAMVSGLLPGFGTSFALRAGVSRYFGRVRARLRVDAYDHTGQTGTLNYDLKGLGGALGALYGAGLGRFLFEAGPELGGSWAIQTTPLQRHSGPMWTGGGIASISMWLGDDFRLGVEGGVAALLVPIDDRWTARPAYSAGLTLGYGF